MNLGQLQPCGQKSQIPKIMDLDFMFALAIERQIAKYVVVDMQLDIRVYRDRYERQKAR